MESKKQSKRKYSSTRRQDQARETRRRILAAAEALFTASGYAGATIEAIAQQADVSPLTIYAKFGNKRSLLAGLIDRAVGGDDQPTPLLQRPNPQAVLKEKDPVRQIHAFAGDITTILDRVAPIFEIMRTAAKTEPEIAELQANILAERLNNIKIFVHHVSANSPLRDGMDEELAAESVWAIASPDVYRLLRRDRGWSQDRFSHWLGDTLTKVLL